MTGRHLTPDEIVAYVLPERDGPAPVPMHLATCPRCQNHVAGLRSALAADRAAVDRAVDGLPEGFWETQRRTVLETVRQGPVPRRSNLLAPLRGRASFKTPSHRSAVIFGSLAASVALAIGLSVTLARPGGEVQPASARLKPTVAVSSISTTSSTAPAARAAGMGSADAADDELLRSVDLLLTGEGPLTNILPEGM